MLADPLPQPGLLCGFLDELADAARSVALSHFRARPGIDWKSDGTPVTAADHGIDQRLRDMIASQLEELGKNLVNDELEFAEATPEKSLEHFLDKLIEKYDLDHNRVLDEDEFISMLIFRPQFDNDELEFKI